MSQTRQKQVLASLLVVLAVTVAWRSLGSLEGRAAFFGGSARGADLAQALETRVVDLDLGSLERGAAEYQAGRDPWRFEPRSPPPRPPTPVVQNPRPVVEAPPQDPKPAEPAKPKPPQIDVELRGILGPERLRIAVFDDGESIFNATEGAVVKDKFRVESIQIESVLLGYVDFPDEQPARLPIRGG